MTMTPIASKKSGTEEIIEANVALLAEQLAAGKSESLKAYLAAMGRFHSYSIGNIFEIARQRPDAVRVAGFQAWKKLGRSVNKGEKGIRILAPLISHRGAKETANDASPSQAPEKGKKPVLFGFRHVHVFDQSQTSGDDLPSLTDRASGDVGPMLARLSAFVEDQGIRIEYTESIAPALGVSYGGRIAIQPGHTDAETFTTLVHELAHELIHKDRKARANTNKTSRELEAEAVAFAVGLAIGLDMGNSSADYIGLYNGDSALLIDSLKVIQTTASQILSAISVDRDNDEHTNAREEGLEAEAFLLAA